MSRTSVLIPLVMLLAVVPVARAAKTGAAPAVTDSLALLERSVARDSSRFDDLYRLGVMYLDREKSEEAVKVLVKANKVRPKNVKVLVNLGAALDNLGKAEFAQGYYREAIAVAPADPIAPCRLASSLYAQGRQGEAVDLLRGLVARDPRSACGFFTLGMAFADAGLYRDAIRMWKRVLESDPASPEATSAKESIEVLERVLAGQ